MKKLFIATRAFIMSSNALAEAYQHPDRRDGTVPARDWTVLSTKPVGDAPADVYEPADPGITYTETDWIVTTAGIVNYEQVSGVDQRKFRITGEPGTAKYLDPILAKGVPPPAAHPHMGIGNVAWMKQRLSFLARRPKRDLRGRASQ